MHVDVVAGNYDRSVHGREKEEDEDGGFCGHLLGTHIVLRNYEYVQNFSNCGPWKLPLFPKCMCSSDILDFFIRMMTQLESRVHYDLP